jgi:vacuolar protein sorting-associated protein 54
MITEADEREDQLSDNDNPPVPKLQNLTALSNSLNQFTQYESLVVQSLSDELVEIFLNWQSTERERVMEMIEALQLCQALSKTSELYQRRLQQLVRMTVRTTIAEFVEPSTSNGGSTGGGVTGMTYPAFYSCLQMLIEELQSITTMAHNVDHFCEVENLFSSHDSQSSGQGQQLNGGNQGQTRWTQVALNQAAELSTKSIAELLRLRKEAHSLITLDEMKQLWDTCLNFSQEMEGYGNTSRAVSLRSTLASQAKAYLDRSHESNMSALVAALDSERWTQCEVSY